MCLCVSDKIFKGWGGLHIASAVFFTLFCPAFAQYAVAFAIELQSCRYYAMLANIINVIPVHSNTQELKSIWLVCACARACMCVCRCFCIDEQVNVILQLFWVQYPFSEILMCTTRAWFAVCFIFYLSQLN